MATTWKPFVKRGRDPRIEELSESTFEDFAAEDDVKIKDLKFSPDLTATSFAGQTKNSASFDSGQSKNTATFTGQTKN